MPKGVYLRSEAQKQHCRTVNMGRCPWNKGKKIGPLSNETKKKLSKAHKGERNHKWKGDEVSYSALHMWIKLNWGKADRCEFCLRTMKPGEERKFEWSNISGKYRRERDDWQMLCARCHREFDNHVFFTHHSNEEVGETEETD